MESAPGLYGKLPAKRDFIALNLPPGFLGVWEDWLQSSIAASREQLRDGWLGLFLSQPIWRFWLGRGICGVAVAGAFMPSVDGVGRYFPLCVCMAETPEMELRPPPVQPMARWYEAAEAALLSALDSGTSGDPLDLLGNMPGIREIDPPPDDSESRLADLLKAELAAGLATESWWWTLGGGGHAPAVKRHRGLPDPYAFSGFMTGAPADSERAA